MFPFREHPDIIDINNNVNINLKGVGIMENSVKAKELYAACGNTDPNENTLLPFYYEPIKEKLIYYPMVLGLMINHYATQDFEDDWIPMNRESFFIGKDDKEGWTQYKSVVYKLEKKGFIESKFESNQNYIRLTHDELYNPEIYKRG